MKPTKDQLQAAVARMTVLKFFPAEPIARAAIMELLSEMVSTTEELSWLVKTMINQVGAWEGPKELRGIFCSRFKPADGIEAYSNTPGFRPADSESAVLALAAGSEQRALPAPAREQPEELTEQERKDIAALQSRVRLLAQRNRGFARPANYQPPAYLRNL